MTQERVHLSEIKLGDAVWEDSFSILFEGSGLDGDRLLLRTFKSDEPSPVELQWLHHDEHAHALAPPGTVHECLGRLKIQHKPYLVYRDEGFRPFRRRYVGDLSASLRLGHDVTHALRLLHKTGMNHNRLSPATVWVHADLPGVRLFDLSGSSTKEGRPRSAPPPELLYLAPEQVGSTAFGCDYRADFFALGVLLYRGVTGQRPFEALDVDSHRHKLLTEMPARPDELDPTVPVWVSELVMRLLNKAPEQRYQTHYGLTYDLTESLAERGGKLGAGQSRIGDRDLLAAFGVPDTFRGREQEQALILEAAKAARSGPLKLVAISGTPGIGKSGLVLTVRERIRRTGMEIVGGKADQFNTDIHYGLFVQAIEARVAQMAAREGQLDTLANRVKELLGVNASLITDVIPQLSPIVGALTEAPKVPSSEGLNRFNATFERFVKILVEVGGPLCLFFDDVQWTDSGSLTLLEYLVSAQSLTDVLVLFCFRSNGDGAIRAEESLQRMADSGASTSILRLEGLEEPQIAQLVGEALGPATDASMCAQLSELVHERTEGNPLFARHLLEHLHAQGLLVFDERLDQWNWDPNEIVQRAITDDVIDLARAKLDRLVPRAKSALLAGACISNPFEPKRIACLIKEPEETVRALLDQAVVMGVLTHVGSGYRFIHDKLAQAAYCIVSDEELSAIRLHFGQRLLEELADSGKSDVPVDVVNNINFGLGAVADPKQRLAYAELNLQAGQEARREAAYRDALNYFRAGMKWAPESAWQSDHRLMFDLYSETFESEYLNGNPAAANALFESLESHAEDRHDLAGVVYTKILLLTGANRGDEAVETGVKALRSLGMRIAAQPSRAQVLSELLLARSKTAFRSLDRLAESPFSEDKTLKATNALLMIIGPAAYFRNTSIMAFVGLRLLNRSISQAHTTESAFGYVIYGLVLSAVTGKPQHGYRFAQLAMKLADRGGDIILRSKIWMISGAFIAFWSQPVTTALNILSASLSQALEAGDIQYANYAVLGTVSLMFSSGAPLSEVLSLNERYEPLVRRTNDTFSMETHRLWREATRTMLDDSAVSLDPSAEKRAMRQFRASGNQTALTYFWALKTQLHYLDEDYATAYKFGMRAKSHSDSVLGQIVVADLFFYLGLSAAALAKSKPDHQKKYASTLKDCRRRFRKWAEGCPENFGQQHEVLSAELQSVRGKNALNAYERAMKSAAGNGFIHIEALANELAAEHLAREEREDLAGVFLERAWRLYREWNGYRKARRLARKHAHLRVLDEVANDQDEKIYAHGATAPTSAVPLGGATDSINHVLEDLCRDANADWGVVFGLTDRGLDFITARDATRDVQSVRASAIVRYVAKSGTSIAIRDCAEDTRFTKCPYLATHRPRSVFCRMLGNTDDPIGVVYLENRSLPSIFSEATVAATRSYLAAIETAMARNQMLADLREKQSRLEQTRRTISKLEQHRDHLGKFVPVPVRRLLAENPEAPDMVRQEREVSVMFVDIAGYTQMNELLGKEAVEKLVDTYFSSFAEEIWQRQGEIVETAGDGFMAVFENPTHGPLAAQTAVALQACTAELNAKHESEFRR
ncbi:MAG: AAA family ATPase [Myxococcales bacterium]|nr:AAA family ATPase [Myxococcales bacterium]